VRDVSAADVGRLRPRVRGKRTMTTARKWQRSTAERAKLVGLFATERRRMVGRWTWREGERGREREREREIKERARFRHEKRSWRNARARRNINPRTGEAGDLTELYPI